VPLLTATVETPLGPLRLTSDGEAVVAAAFGAAPAPDDECPVLAEAGRQLRAYFAGDLEALTAPARPGGTPFQRRVWAALAEEPPGQTVTYGALADRLGDPKAVRAVGAACGQNPALVVVPCHRAVGAGGALVGYAGGLPRKRALLALERRQRSLFG
jgi:methylated-DNA-[protein]-cysteine S-methyltransferase